MALGKYNGILIHDEFSFVSMLRVLLKRQFVNSTYMNNKYIILNQYSWAYIPIKKHLVTFSIVKALRKKMKSSYYHSTNFSCCLIVDLLLKTLQKVLINK